MLAASKFRIYNFGTMSKQRTAYTVTEPEEVRRIETMAERIISGGGTRIFRLLEANGVESGKLLELSSGVGVFTAELVERFPDVRVTALERSEALAASARERWSKGGLTDRIEFHLQTGEELPFDDNSFDYVFGFGLGPSIADPVRYFSEVDRVLKRTGKFLINFPLRTWHAIFRSRLRRFLSASEVRKGINTSGFRSCRLLSPRSGTFLVTNLHMPMMGPGGGGRGGPGPRQMR